MSQLSDKAASTPEVDQAGNAQEARLTLAERWWRCYRCGKAFLHARWLARHLINLHGETK